MKIAVAGTGYVGMSLAVLLAQKNNVAAVDIVPARVDLVNARRSPIQDDCIEEYLSNKPLNLRATTDWRSAYGNADFVVVATPTNYDPQKNFFDCSAVEDVVRKVLDVNPAATIVIKSTVPVGYTRAVRERFGTENIIFSPEFLRESKALYDNLYPSRIIVGFARNGSPQLEARARAFARMVKDGALRQDVPVLFMGGVVGRLFYEFAVVIITAILFSGVVSLSLTPMLCAYFLKPQGQHRVGYEGFYGVMERAFDRLADAYDASLAVVLRHRFLTLLLSILLLFATGWLGAVVPKGFLPSEDEGFIDEPDQMGELTDEDLALEEEANKNG